MVTDELLAAALPKTPRWELVKQVERRAQSLTWHAWLKRQQGRLHPVPDADLSTEAARRWAEETYSGYFVGIVPPESVLTSDEFHTHQLCRVGIWGHLGQGGFLNNGPELVLLDLEGHGGSTLHRGVGLVGFIHILPRPFQEIAREAHRIRHSEWDDEEQCYFVYDDDFEELDIDRVTP